MIFNKSYVVRDPVSHKKRFVYNPPSEWTKVDVPHLRIVGDDLWQAVRARDRGNKIDLLAKKDKRPPKKPLRELNSHNQHALTGYVRCGACGGLKNVANSSRYVCSANRYAKSCPNARGTHEADVRSALFRAFLNRVRVGDPFRPLLLARFDAEAKRVKQIDDKEKDILAKVDRLVDAVEQGVEETFVIQRIADYQRQLADFRGERARLFKPDLPSEASIRKKFAYELNYLTRCEDVVEVRRALRLLRPVIVLTPIPGRWRGETIQVTVDDRGWPDFWRLIAK